MNTLKRIVRKEGKTVEIKDVKNKAGQSYKEFYEDMLEANAELQKRIAELEADKVSLTKDLAEKQEQLDQTAHKALELEADNQRLRELLHVESDWVFLQSPDDEPINQPPKEQAK